MFRTSPQIDGSPRRLIAENYPAIAKDLLNPVLDLLRVSRETCGGDADKFLILLAVAVRTAEHRQFPTFTPDELESGAVPELPSLGTNIRSVAEWVGIPKETVRRKVAELVETGWIARDGNQLSFTAAAYPQLTPVRRAIEALAARNFQVVAALLADAKD